MVLMVCEVCVGYIKMSVVVVINLSVRMDMLI